MTCALEKQARISLEVFVCLFKQPCVSETWKHEVFIFNVCDRKISAFAKSVITHGQWHIRSGTKSMITRVT